jgi:hypothetical protein
MEEERKEGKKRSRNEGGNWKLFIILVVVGMVILISLLYITFHTKKCSDADCFNSAMSECSRASFVSEADDASWLYTIDGPTGNFLCSVIHGGCDICNIRVKLLQVKNGTEEVGAIEGLDMNCALAFEYIGVPNADLSKCHGELKEGLQDLMINKMHAYILANVGKIGTDLNKGI